MPLLKYSRACAMTITTLVSVSIGLSGCTAPNTPTNTTNAAGDVTGAITARHSDIAQVVRTRYNSHNHSVTLYTRQNQSGATRQVTDASLGELAGGAEDTIHASMDDAVVNYATSRYASKHIRQVVLVDLSATRNHSQSRTVMVPNSLIAPGTVVGDHTVPTGTTVAPKTGTSPTKPSGHLASSITSTHNNAVSITTSATGAVDAAPAMASGVPIPPPGVRIDHSIQPLAPTSASYQQKFQAIMSVATSKLGTPYIWGHNEDRGQYGFDCSNFTEYVYHHALGYLFTTASRGQNLYVGVSIPIGQMRPGDLMIFDNGGHVGIYAGNGQAIQEGGGLAKVGYLKVSSGSYWGRHTTAVKRMF